MSDTYETKKGLQIVMEIICKSVVYCLITLFHGVGIKLRILRCNTLFIYYIFFFC